MELNVSLSSVTFLHTLKYLVVCHNYMTEKSPYLYSKNEIVFRYTLYKCFPLHLNILRGILTFWSQNYFFFNFSTHCIQNVNKTGTKYVRIMEQTAF